MLPLENTYPTITNPITLRASAALPAAGAWDSTPLTIAMPMRELLFLFCTYTRGGVGGAVDIQIQVSPSSSGTTWASIATVNVGTITAGSDVQSRVQRGYYTYQATGASAESFAIALRILIPERIRVLAKESGAVGSPGTLAITGYLR